MGEFTPCARRCPIEGNLVMPGVRRSKLGRALAVLAALSLALIAVVGTQAIQSQQPASATLSGSNFDPGYIISDYEFFDSTAMSQTDIQNFLDAQCPSKKCIGHINFTSTTMTPGTTSDSNSYCPSTYTGAATESAASIIYKVEQACDISAKVILVTLQKEQGLITKQNPSNGALQAAMGYGCPDTAPCNTASLGFFRQIYDAAWQFQEYSVNRPHSTTKPLGVNKIQYSPNTKCGTETVNIRNEATRGLYIYTPYVPNAAALANLSGVGDSCSSYGNRNFWVYYNTWFGSSTTTVPPSVTSVTRDAGSDRFATSVAVSQAGFAPGVPVVYIANGLNYPDALAAGPAAAKQGGPLLLVEPHSIPATVLTELKRLQPQKIVVVGGTPSVDNTVFSKLAALVPAASPANITRIGGADRYATSRDLVSFAFGTSAPKAFIATGLNFADALAASAAAGTEGAPIILVDGKSSAPDAATTSLLGTLGTTKLVFVGSTPSISASMATGLSNLPGITSTVRYGGTDRYATSYLLNEGEFTAATSVYLATGTNYPDALAGAALAGAQHAPLYIVHPTCIPSHVLSDFLTLAPTSMVMLGGLPSLSAAVGNFVGC